LETDIDKVLHFNRAMLCKARIMLPQDIFCSSVTIRCCIKTAEHIVILSALGSPIILVFCEPNRFPQCADHPGTTRSREHEVERAHSEWIIYCIVLFHCVHDYLEWWCNPRFRFHV